MTCMPLADGEGAAVGSEFSSITWGVELPEFTAVLSLAGTDSGVYAVVTAPAGEFLGEPLPEPSAPFVTRTLLVRFDAQGALEWLVPISLSNETGNAGWYDVQALPDGSAALLVTTASLGASPINSMEVAELG